MNNPEIIKALEKFVPKKQIEKYLGCLIGGAAGDALGYPVEFMYLSEIKEIYGKQGIMNYELQNGVAEISDDTQMTLFTAAGYLLGAAKAMYGENGVGPRYTYCRNTYRDWLITQGKLPKPKDEVDLFTWLMRVPVLFSRRAPGLTCLDFDFNNPGSIENPTNDSKGCGGVMRVAPVGLIYPAFFEISENEGAKVVLEGAQCAALTHGGELGYIPAGCLAQIINLASHTDKKIKDIIEKALRDTAEMFSEKSDFPYFQKIITKAIVLSKSKMNDEQCIHEIGEGWVAEEALAIAIYCALRHSNDFAAAIRAAVNHDGDSDSTGSIVGNILGAYLGASAIPDFYKKNLELVDVIYELALDLAIGRFAKYMPSNYENKDEFELKYISSK